MLKAFTGIAVAAALTSTFALGQEKKAPQMDAKTRISYALGVDIGSNLKENFSEVGIEVDPGYIARGVLDGFSGKAAMTPEQVQDTLAALQREIGRRQIANAVRTWAEDKTLKDDDPRKKAVTTYIEGQRFLAANQKKESVKTTSSGLQYEVLKQGDGKRPTESDVVKVHYHGTLIDGTVFDSSVERKNPAQFAVGQVIPGWIEGLQLMSVGSKYRLYIPCDLAYGLRNQGKIPPCSVLVFEVELLEIVDQSQLQPPGLPRGE